MTFFEHQNIARRNTRVMVVLFVLAVIGVIIAMDAFIAALYVLFQSSDLPDDASINLIAAFRAVPADVYMWGAIITFVLIVFESVKQIFKLRAGGEAIATAFGARRVEAGTSDPLERRLLNIVEEMAIASGVRVPAVYVLDKETGINAFAAGFDVSNSIVAVTRGTLETLNRDELQGVIGHEFSHILNGDTSLNIRMMGVLAGIVVIGSLGLFIIRCAFEADDWRGFIAIFAVGAVVCVIGFTGLFFARVIKASVSREREFLADSSSVQFTRNPDGIAGALDQIRSCERGTLIHHRYAEEVSHMFFGQSINVWFGGLFATHPPLDERIRRVSPNFEPKHYRQARPAQAAGSAESADTGIPAAAVGFAGGAAAEAAGARGSDCRPRVGPLERRQRGARRHFARRAKSMSRNACWRRCRRACASVCGTPTARARPLSHCCSRPRTASWKNNWRRRGPPVPRGSPTPPARLQKICAISGPRSTCR